MRVDDAVVAKEMQEFAKHYLPKLVDRIEYYAGDRPIFDIYSVEDEIQKALQRKVHLKSGGYLIFDQTEAMTTIDVNTGSYLGHGIIEETIFMIKKIIVIFTIRYFHLDAHFIKRIRKISFNLNKI